MKPLSSLLLLLASALTGAAAELVLDATGAEEKDREWLKRYMLGAVAGACLVNALPFATSGAPYFMKMVGATVTGGLTANMPFIRDSVSFLTGGDKKPQH